MKGESVMGTKHFTQRQKLAVLKSVSKIGMKEAAKLAGKNPTTVIDEPDL